MAESVAPFSTNAPFESFNSAMTNRHLGTWERTKNATTYESLNVLVSVFSQILSKSNHVSSELNHIPHNVNLLPSKRNTYGHLSNNYAYM